MTTYSEYSKLIQDIAVQFGRRLIITNLVARFSFLNWTPCLFIAGLIIDAVLKRFVYVVDTKVFFMYTDLRVTEQGRIFIQSARDNQRIQQIGTPEEREISEKLLISNFDKLVKLC